MKLLLIFAGICLYLHQAAAKSELRIRFIRFSNEENRVVNGDCCDGTTPITNQCLPNPCDVYFKICLDEFETGSSSMTSCPCGSLVSEVVDRNNNVFYFGNTFGGLSNPTIFTVMATMQTNLLLKIQAYDDDVFSRDDLVADFSKKISLRNGDAPMTVTLTSHTSSLEIELERVCAVNFHGQDCETYCEGECPDECSPDYYGPSCGVYCARPQLYDHYKCNPMTGSKICEEGWSGDSCDVEGH